VTRPMLRTTDLARLVVQARVTLGAIVVDATVGNGHDTLMLVDAVGPTGCVYGFDVQADALARTRVRLGARTNVELFEAGHERLAALLPVEVHGRISAMMFNLGYLPGAARHITTQSETTKIALKAGLSLLAPGGMITLVLYPGHAAGVEEAASVRAMVAALPVGFSAHSASRLNSVTAAPELIIIERLSSQDIS
jgi:predicted methyltransferase